MLNLRKPVKLLLITVLVLIPATVLAHAINISDDFSSTAGWDVHDGSGPSQIYIDTANKRLVTSINRNSGDTLWAFRAVPVGTNDYELTYGFYVESFTNRTFVKFGLHGSQETSNTGSATHFYPYHNMRLSYSNATGSPLSPFCFWYDGMLSLAPSPGPTLAEDQPYWARLTKNGLDYRCEIYSDKFETLLWGATITAPSELNLTQVGADQTHDNFGSHSITVYNFDMHLTISVPTPDESLQDVCNELQEVVDSNPGTALADKVEDARDKCQTALDELAKAPPDNQAAVGNMEGAVGDIQAAVELENGLDSEQGKELMDRLAGVAQHIAVDALDQATACDLDHSDIADARHSLAEGDELRASGAYKDAVNKYKDALAKAEGVAESCE